ncbi:MAG TPA: hypothetical protein VI790_05520 [Candidatus Nanoarchaeia archaeon]|nr:hypothetical protein [Candidatus Nanoarchaeia archaeon]
MAKKSKPSKKYSNERMVLIAVLLLLVTSLIHPGIATCLAIALVIYVICKNYN